MNQGFIYLASASPRRAELLSQVQIPFRACPVDIDETWHDGELPVDYVTRMAQEKAQAASQSIDADGVILAADTSVVIDGAVLGKPRDRDDACAMLSRLSGKEHHVFTAICVIQDGQMLNDLCKTRVVFRVISQREKEGYWATGEAADKAGAYSIQGVAAVFVQHIEGSYSGVMGLPLFETVRLLQRCGINSLNQDN